MRIKLKTLVYRGEQSEVHDHDLYGKVFLFPRGTERDVRVLLLPSFKKVIMTQEATIDEGVTPNDGIHYARNCWTYVSDTLKSRITRSDTIYLDNVLVKNRYGKKVQSVDMEELLKARFDWWLEEDRTLFLKSK